MKCGTRDTITLPLSSTRGIILTIDSILIRMPNQNNQFSWNLKENMILMRSMRLKELGSQIILTFPRIETFMVSSVGFPTSMLSAPKIMMLDTLLIENILMDLWITMSLSTTLQWPTVNSSVRTHHQNQLPEKECRHYQSKIDLNTVALWGLLNQLSRLAFTQHPLF